MMVEVFGSLLLTWEMCMEFLAPGFNLIQPLNVVDVWGLIQDTEGLTLSFSYSAF